MRAQLKKKKKKVSLLKKLAIKDLLKLDSLVVLTSCL